jgi:cytochrome oxidase Cu insertion factor (SCO1/SenC/PrrC family)
MKKVIVIGIVAVLALLLLSSCSGNSSQGTPAATTPPTAPVVSTSLPAAETAPSVGIQVGSMVPDFQLNDLNGKQVSLKDFRGKPVLLNFWATW